MLRFVLEMQPICPLEGNAFESPRCLTHAQPIYFLEREIGVFEGMTQFVIKCGHLKRGVGSSKDTLLKRGRGSPGVLPSKFLFMVSR